MIRWVCVCLLFAGPAFAEAIVAVRTIPAQTILGADDIAARDVLVSGGLTDPGQVIGQETRVALFAGRPIRAGEIGPPAVVQRNQIISIVYAANGLMITAEGRALDRASPGERIRVMNLASRNTITAIVDESGVAYATR